MDPLETDQQEESSRLAEMQRLQFLTEITNDLPVGLYLVTGGGRYYLFGEKVTWGPFAGLEHVAWALDRIVRYKGG